MRETVIRTVSPNDGAALLEIYAPYIRETAITFEYDVPTLAQFQDRIRNTLKRYPYLAVEEDGVLLGYAYTGPFVGRAAYDWGAETSIYLRMDQRRRGLGRALYQAIETVSAAQNILNLNACIGWPDTEDRYLTRNSVEFHRHMGYRLVGRFEKCGYKFGTWYDMVWMEKLLGAHPALPSPVIPFPALGAERLRQMGIGVPSK